MLAEAAHSWAVGRWTLLGPTGESSRIGCGLAVVHDRLYVSGGVDEVTGFDNSVARWDGTMSDLVAAERCSDWGVALLDCTRAWTRVDGLELPIAMHAHSALTVPMVP